MLPLYTLHSSGGDILNEGTKIFIMQIVMSAMEKIKQVRTASVLGEVCSFLNGVWEGLTEKVTLEPMCQ